MNDDYVILPGDRITVRVWGAQEVNWTIRAKEEMEAAEQAGNLVIFECFDPEV